MSSEKTLLYDYRTNVASYPECQAWLRQHQPATLVAWGANDPSFTAPGAEAFKSDRQDAEIHLLDAGHFALDQNTDVAGKTCRKNGRKNGDRPRLLRKNGDRPRLLG
jgi:hypothetical protein